MLASAEASGVSQNDGKSSDGSSPPPMSDEEDDKAPPLPEKDAKSVSTSCAEDSDCTETGEQVRAAALVVIEENHRAHTLHSPSDDVGRACCAHQIQENGIHERGIHERGCCAVPGEIPLSPILHTPHPPLSLVTLPERVHAPLSRVFLHAAPQRAADRDRDG